MVIRETICFTCSYRSKDYRITYQEVEQKNKFLMNVISLEIEGTPFPVNEVALQLAKKHREQRIHFYKQNINTPMPSDNKSKGVKPTSDTLLNADEIQKIIKVIQPKQK